MRRISETQTKRNDCTRLRRRPASIFLKIDRRGRAAGFFVVGATDLDDYRRLEGPAREAFEALERALTRQEAAA